MRSLNGVCLISVDEELLSKSLVNHLIFIADSVFKLTSFKGMHMIPLLMLLYRSLRNEDRGV